MTDRGVSEVIGFVLVFTLVTATIGIVYATGFTALDDARHAEQVENMVRAFDVLDDNLGDLYRQGAPSRATEVKLAGGSIQLADAINVSVSVTNNTNSDHNASFNAQPHPIVYDAVGDQTVTYVLGSTFRASGNGAIMVTEPDFVVDSDRAMFPVIGTFPHGTDGFSGQVTVLVVASVNSRSVPTAIAFGPDHDATLNVTIDSPRAGAWRDYFESNGYSIETYEAGKTVSATRVVSDSVRVAFTSVNVEFQS